MSRRVLLTAALAGCLVGLATVAASRAEGPTAAARSLTIPATCRSQEPFERALLQAADAWARADPHALIGSLSPDGHLVYEDHRDGDAASYGVTEIADYLSTRTPPTRHVQFGRIEPPFGSGAGVVYLHAFVIEGGLDYPVLFEGRTDCMRGVVFRELSVSVGSR